MMDQTPIYDIKPYLPYVDAHPEASGGFIQKQTYHLEVQIPDEGMKKIPEEKRKVVMQILSQIQDLLIRMTRREYMAWDLMGLR